MKRRIFHHPVGMFPTGARWYLASIAILSLLALAMHLSVQMFAQQKAEALIRQWGKAADVEIGDVHYHLLRNALILQRINVVRGEDSVSMQHMLLRANPALLTGDTPQIGRVEIAGFEARLSHAGARGAWRRDEALKKLWRAAGSLSLREGTVRFHPGAERDPPLVFTDLSLRQQLQGTRPGVTATARLQGAPVHWQWQADGTGSAAKGKLGWQDVDAGLIAASFGLKPIAGTLKGYLNWIPADHTAAAAQTPDMEGRVELDAGDGISGRQLQWQGRKNADRWQLDISARAWPLEAWTDSLPRISGKSLVSGQLSGDLFWQQRPDGWRLSSNRGELRDVVYVRQDNSGDPAWRWGKIDYEDVSLDPASRRLVASDILLADAGITLQPQPAAAAERTVTMEQTADWSIDAGGIRVQELTLGLNLEQGSVEIGALQGDGSWSADGVLNFDLESVAADVDGAGNSPPSPFWRMRGEAVLEPGAATRAQFDLEARHVPLSRLRPLVPLADAKTRLLTLEGRAHLELMVMVERDIWQARGLVAADDIRLSHGGDMLAMQQLAIKLGPVGTGLPVQRIDSLDIRGWHYITVLNPVPPLATVVAEEAEVSEFRQPWWAELLRSRNWSVAEANWLDGTVSVGHEDARWAERLNIHIHNIGVDQWADIGMRGMVDGGEFALNGSWDALGETNRFRGKASLHHALPFFLRTWMGISGMPRPLRGRLSAELSVAEREAGSGYIATVRIRMLRGLTGMGVFPDDPLLSRTGFSTADVLTLLNRQGGDVAELNFEVAGNWRERPLNLERLGQAMQSALQEKIGKQEKRDFAVMPEPAGDEAVAETQIRLHGSDSLSLNERIRLHGILRALRRSNDLVVDLVPNWAGESLDAELLARIQYTQGLIERYMGYRSIPRARVFPLWPTAVNRIKGVGSISVVVRRHQSSPG